MVNGLPRFLGSLWLLAALGCVSPPLPSVSIPERLTLAVVDTGPWKPAGPVERYGRKDFELVVGRKAINYLPYAVTELEVLRVARNEVKLEIRLWRCKTTEEAFCLYSVQRATVPGHHPAALGASAFTDEMSLHVWKGRYVLGFRGVGDYPPEKKDLRNLAELVLRYIDEPSRPPRLVRALPPEGLWRGSIFVFRTPETIKLSLSFHAPEFVGLGKDEKGRYAVEGIYARYMFSTHDATIFVLAYRDPARAKKTAEIFMRERYRPEAKAFRDKGWVTEAELSTGARALTFLKGPLVILVPPTHASKQITAAMARFFKNLKRMSDELKAKDKSKAR